MVGYSEEELKTHTFGDITYPEDLPHNVKMATQLVKGEITAANLVGPDKGKPLSVLVKAIQDGDAYVNIHTQEHKSGEIRGQLK